ncbi:MAG: GumC family protein [Methylovirgula sp.]
MSDGLSIDSGRRAGIAVTLWRRRKIFLAVFGAVFGLSIVALIVLPVSYLATGSVIVAEPEPGLNNVSGEWAQKIGDPADLESQLLVIRSPRVMRLAMQRPGVFEAVQRECRYVPADNILGRLLHHSSSCDKLTPDSDALITYVDGHYAIGSVGRSRVINIAYKSRLPDVAQTLANALVNAFLDDQRAQASKSRGMAAAWLWQELHQLDNQLRDQDAEIQAFRRKNGLMRGATAPISSEHLTSISQQLAAAVAARADAAAHLKEIRDSATGDFGDAPSVLNSRTVADIKQQLNTVSAQLASASNILGPDHPTLKALRQQRDALRDRLREEIGRVTASAQKTFDAADNLVKSLSQQLTAAKAEVSTAMGDEASIASMVRQTEIKRQEYSELYKRASELETERRVLLGSTRLVSLAELPDTPFFPKRVPFLAAGFTLALMAAAAAAFLRDRSDRSVRGAADLTALTGEAVFGELPALTREGQHPFLQALIGQRSKLPLREALLQAEDDDVLQDALRKLYANLMLARRGSDLWSMLITSPGAGEGKTFTTLALAQFIAKAGRRVLVVECDFQSPSIVDALDLGYGPGLAEIITEDCDIEDAIVETWIDTLDILPAGDVSDEAIELLEGNDLADLAEFARSYDLVLFDGPSAHFLVDRSMLAELVDGVLCCARWGHSSINETLKCLDLIDTAGGHILGLAITMVEPEDRSFYESTPILPLQYAGAAE